MDKLRREPNLRGSHLLTRTEVSSSPEERKCASPFYPSLDVVRKRDHAHRLPNPEGNARCDTTVETLHPVLPVDEGKSVQNCRLSGSVGVRSRLGH